jgi:DNA polymerase-3 subunit beta
MKITCEKNSLLEGINIVQKAVSSKSTNPVLEGILLETVEDKLKLTGNDMEICIVYKVKADIQKQGKIILNSKTFGEIVRKLPNAPVIMELKENNEISISCGYSKFRIKSMIPEGYPQQEEIIENFVHTIKQDKLKDMIRQTIFAISVDEKNKTLNGSLFEFNVDKFSIVSIDGFRMAIRNNKDFENGEEYKVIIPGKTLNEVSKVFTNSDEDVTIKCGNKQVEFVSKDCLLISKLIGRDYLNYSTFIPKDVETSIIINRSELLSSIERASIIANEDKKYPVKFELTDEKLTISSKTELGEVQDELFPEIEGNEITASFNPRYYLDALKNIEDENVKINFTTTIGPSIIVPIENDNYIYMILPVRT